MKKTLYTRDILQLAMSNTHEGRIENPDGSAELRSRTCGSRMIVDVLLSHDHAISDLGVDAHTCAFGQASAAILSGGAIGKTLSEIQDTAQQLESYLAHKATVPIGWPDIAKLETARDYPGRHSAILLPFKTLMAAIEMAAIDDALNHKNGFAANGETHNG